MNDDLQHFRLSCAQRVFLASVPFMALVVMMLGLYLTLSETPSAKAQWQADLSRIYTAQAMHEISPSAAWSRLSQARIHALQALSFQPYDRDLWDNVMSLEDRLASPRFARYFAEDQLSGESYIIAAIKPVQIDRSGFMGASGLNAIETASGGNGGSQYSRLAQQIRRIR